MTIRELRILPPLAVGRLGAADCPMDNYDAEVDGDRPLDFRRLRPTATFRVDPDSGEITETFVPDELRFTDEGKARPVAPFLEVWAVTADDALEPLTVDLLDGHGLSPEDLRWSVDVGNYKLFRRTRIDADKIDAAVGSFSDHVRHPLLGTSPNFWPGKRLPLGWVQYVKPTDGYPEIRLRFTPARGYVYGSSTATPPAGKPADANIVDVLYDASPGRGTWLGYFDRGDDPGVTSPSQIYFGEDVGGNWVSKGYLDDECDGLVRVELTVDGTTLAAYGRIGAGPPAYAPDGFPIRTVADELEQALFGPETPDGEASLDRVEEIVRRAFETVRLMNTAIMNGNPVNGVPIVASQMAAQDSGDTGRFYEPIMAPSLVDQLALRALHETILTALRSGTAPWFVDVLRNFDEIGDLSNKGRRKMPALMRGADARYLTLTRRQVDLIRKVAQRDIFAADQPKQADGPASQPTPTTEKRP
jgi:hypothetical protein